MVFVKLTFRSHFSNKEPPLPKLTRHELNALPPIQKFWVSVGVIPCCWNEQKIDLDVHESQVFEHFVKHEVLGRGDSLLLNQMQKSILIQNALLFSNTLPSIRTQDSARSNARSTSSHFFDPPKRTRKVTFGLSPSFYALQIAHILKTFQNWECHFVQHLSSLKSEIIPVL